MRETTISVSYEEKNRLEYFKTELFNSKEVSYGAVLGELMDTELRTWRSRAAMSTSANNDPSCYYWVRDDDRDFITTPDGEVVNIARLTAYAEYGDEIFDKHAHHEIPLGKITAPRFIDALSSEEHGRLHGSSTDPVEVDGIPLLCLDP